VRERYDRALVVVAAAVVGVLFGLQVYTAVGG
jgi:hypothetical protein